MRKCFTLLFLFSLLSNFLTAQTRYTQLKDVTDSNLIFNLYSSSETKTIDVADLILIDGLISKPGMHSFYWETDDFRTILLKQGYAKLKDSTNSKKEEIDAQNIAKQRKVGFWYEKPAPDTTQKPVYTSEVDKPTDSIESENDSFIKNAWDFIKANFIWFLGFVGLGVIIQYIFRPLYRKFYIERKFRLLLVGDTAAGKSALHSILLDPDISKEKILASAPSDSSMRIKRREKIIWGKYEITPELIDTAGTKPETFFNIKNQVVVFVLAPVQHNGQIESIEDSRYIDKQEGILQTYLGYIISEAKNGRRPKILILFINKFDLLSKKHPDDSSSKNQKQAITSLFSTHINILKSEAKKIDIPYAILIGSAVEKWSTKEIQERITRELYKKQ